MMVRGNDQNFIFSNDGARQSSCVEIEIIVPQSSSSSSSSEGDLMHPADVHRLVMLNLCGLVQDGGWLPDYVGNKSS